MRRWSRRKILKTRIGTGCVRNELVIAEYRFSWRVTVNAKSTADMEEERRWDIQNFFFFLVQWETSHEQTVLFMEDVL